MLQGHEKIAFYLLALAILLTGCEKGISREVLPDLVKYDNSVQELAAFEISELNQPCPRDVVIPSCSALKRMVMDYGDVRNQIRAISHR